MADLELEKQNTAEVRTELIATPHDLGPNQLKDFVGDNILEVKPGTTLLNSRHSNFGGIFARGVGTGVGVLGEATNNAGVHGRSSNGVGVWGHGGGEREGVLGDSQDNAGVRGVSTNSHGVRGEGQTGVVGTSSATGFSGVSGTHTGQGYGVVGDGAGASNAGVLGRNSTGHGVRGEGSPGVVGINSTTGAGAGPDGGAFASAGVLGHSRSGPGVHGEGTYGGQFEGSGAQLRLVPGTSAGRPTTGAHTIGEIYMDSAARLWVCVASGSPGMWVSVLTAE
jgi:hypothetical protein